MNSALPRRPPPPELVASWTRSREHGLSPDQPLPDAPVSAATLADEREANARLLTFSRPVIENLYRQIGSPASTVLLADSRGLVLSAVGDTDFMDRAAQVALSPGMQWSEAAMGTNAIGTALHTGATVAVRGQQHFLRRNHFLSCVATPILAPGGGVLGILDVSTDARGDISHADALLRTTVELIEHRLVESLEGGFVTLRFHRHPELLGSPLEALAVFDEGGQLIASNRPARGFLGLDAEHPAATCEECFVTAWSWLLAWAALRQSTPFPLRTRLGHTFAARASLAERRSGIRPPATGPARTVSRLAAMRLGDERVAALLDRLADIGRNGAPLVIEGETGSGKTHLARAFHHDHGGVADAPLVTLDCSTLAAGREGEDEARGALRWAGRGVLLLKEIGDMPTPLQAALLRAAGAPGSARLIATTTRSLAELETAGRFARHAFDARAGRVLTLPPLRERADFAALVRLFVREASPERPIYVCPDAVALLARYRWPGNLRELRNRLRLIVALMGDEAGQLCPEDIPDELLEDDA